MKNAHRLGWVIFLAGAAVPVLAQPVSAAVATYSTFGGFSDAGVGYGQGATTSIDDTPTGGSFTTDGGNPTDLGTTGSATLTFAGDPGDTTNIPGTIDLGELTLTLVGDQSLATASGAEFDIDLDFSSPNTGGDLQGDVAVNFGASTGTASVIFDPPTVLFYTSNGQNFTITPNSLVVTAGQPTEVTGTITYVPEPVSAGVLVLGAMGLGRRRRGV